MNHSPHQLRKDPVTGRWVIINQESPQTQFPVSPNTKSSKVCPFCPGQEAMTPPAIMSYPKKGAKDGSWQVRVVPNKFPALNIEGSNEKISSGVYDKIGGFGAHELIIETPDHYMELADMPAEDVRLVLRAYRDRYLDLRKDPRIKYILIFKNYGAAAGASLEHPHSQLIGLPIVPSRVLGELAGAAKHIEFSESCIFCDMLKQEEHEKKLTVHSENGYLGITPFASRLPFETWILPQEHQASFDLISDAGLDALAHVLKIVLAKLKNALNDPPFNFMIHTQAPGAKDPQSFHWHIEIIPHLTHLAGFELGTGFYVNPTPPEMAAEILRAG